MDTKLTQAFMRALRTSIDAEGMTAIAVRAGVSVQTVSGWVNGGKTPRLDHAGKVAKAVGFDLGKHNS